MVAFNRILMFLKATKVAFNATFLYIYILNKTQDHETATNKYKHRCRPAQSEQSRSESPRPGPSRLLDNFTPGACRVFLDGLVKTALMYDESYDNTYKREALIHWHGRTLRYIEAGFAEQQRIQDGPESLRLPPPGAVSIIA